jgi:hypothetical protein
MKRIFYREFYIAKDSQKVTSNKLSEESAVCYISASATGRVNVQFFVGKQVKPDKYLAFKSRDSANAAIEAFFENMVQVVEYKEQQKQKQKAARQAAKDNFQGVPGSVFVASWGYEQTNVDAYQMTRRINNQTIEVIEIGFEIASSEGFVAPMAAKVRPVPVSAEVAAEKPKLRARITAENRIQVAEQGSAGNADLWDTKEVYYHSWYA